MHERGLSDVERHGFALYYSMILAPACAASCQILRLEDFQSSQVVEQELKIVNPFATRI